jgi:hypothetical protein
MTRRDRAENDAGFARPRVALAVASAFVFIGVTACFPPDEGQGPDLDRIYFPTGLTLSPREGVDSCGNTDATEAKHRWLYVANSNFDLQFNAGTVQVFDLEQIDALIQAMNVGAKEPENRCPSVRLFKDKNTPDGHEFGGKKTAFEQFISPGECKPAGTKPLIKARIKIGSFATDIKYLKRPNNTDNLPDMLVVPVRGDDTLHWIDTNPDSEDKLIDCGNQDGACDDRHRRGDNASEDNTRSAELPREPFGIAADQRGEAIITTHHSDGALGLFVNDWNDRNGPSLKFTLTGLPTGAVGIAAIPEPDVALALQDTPSSAFYEPAFYVTFRNAAQIQLVSYFSDKGDFRGQNLPTDQITYPPRAFLNAPEGRRVPVAVNSQGFDSRGIAVEGSRRHNCECACDQKAPDCRAACVDAAPQNENDKTQKAADCDPNATPPGRCVEYVNCLRSCAPTPLDVFISNRTPATLILGQTSSNSSATSSDDLPSLFRTQPVSAGPSRVVVGGVRVPDGNGGTRPEGRVFVICFDSRQIFVYNPLAGRFESVIRTGRGPHSFVVDEGRGRGYVGHFTDSYIGVVELDQSKVNTYGKMILTIGQPTPPRAQK